MFFSDTTRPEKRDRVVLVTGRSDVLCTLMYIHWTNHVLQSFLNTRPCITGYPGDPVPAKLIDMRVAFSAGGVQQVNMLYTLK